MIYSEFPLCFCALSIPLRKWKSLSGIQLFAHGLYSPWNSPGQNTGVGSYSLLQGIFPTQDGTQVSTLQVDSLPAEPLGKPKNTGVGSLSLLFGGSSRPRNWTGVSCIAGGFFQLHCSSLIDPGMFSLHVSLHWDCSFCFSWPSSPSAESLYEPMTRSC